MNESEFQRLREQSWRRKLTAEEESRLNDYLAVDSEAQADWEAEAALTHVLSQLPQAPIASNFTAQVMQAIDREPVAGVRGERKRLAFRQWLQSRFPRIAWATLPAACALLAYAAYQYQEIRRTEFVESVARVSTVAAAIDPKLFEDFEAIRRLSQVPADDSELLAALRSNN